MNRIMKRGTSLIMMLAMVFSVLALTGCYSTKVVPPGTVVIVLEASGDSNIYTSGSYSAFGRDRVYFVDTKLKSFSESMDILCKDDINMTVDVKWIGSFSVTKDNIQIIKEKVPAVRVDSGDIVGYQLSLDKFYATAMRDIIRTYSRQNVSKYATDNIREERENIQLSVRTAVYERFKTLGFPIKSTDIMISNLDYPDEITAQRKAIKNAQLEDEKQAALAIAAIKQAERAAAIARENGKAQVEEARADAAANLIRSESLTPQIIQMRQWDVLSKIGGRDGDLMIVPYQALGGKVDTAMITKSVDRTKN